MQLPNLSTPVSKCLALAAYCSRMLDKFPDNPTLAELSRRLKDGARALRQAQDTYEQAVEELLDLRVDVKYENYLSDRCLHRTQQLAEIEDGRRGGRIASQLFPRDTSPITRLQGTSRIIAMQNLEARLMAARALWPQAAAERAAIAERRSRYQAALHAREAKQQEIKRLRTARNAAKEQFIHLYAEVMYSVRAEFTYDRQLQELFFDRVRPRSNTSEPDTIDSADLVANEAAAKSASKRSSKPAPKNLA